jgi:hypothetical protein
MPSDDRILDVIGLLIVFGLVFGLGTLVFFGGGTGPGNPLPDDPDANWTVTRVNDTHVQLGHTGGDSVQSERLALTVDGEERSVPWSGEVSQGDVATVRAPAGSELELRWTGGSGDPVTLGEWSP